MKQIAYVTGADRGLGFELSKVLLERGYRVFAGCFMPELNELQALKSAHGDNLAIVKLDVSDQVSVESAAKEIHQAAGSLNVLINNAGSARDRSGTILDQQYIEDIRAMMEVNAYGPLRVTQSVLDLLMKGEPRTLVNISSVAGSIGLLTRTNQYGYTMTKAAVNIQSKLIHNHLKGQGLKVMAIHPGGMRTHILGEVSLKNTDLLEPLESARSIVDLIQDQRDVGDNIFMDYTGKTLPW